MGYSQVVRQRVLIPPFRWFESSYPSQITFPYILGYSQAVRHRILIPAFQRFESFYPSQKRPRRCCDEGIFLLTQIFFEYRI